MLAKPFLCLLRYGAALCLLAIVLPASADCVMTHYPLTTSVRTVMRESGGYTFKNYGAVCDKLNKANAGVAVFGTYAVAKNRSVAWAIVQAVGKDNTYLTIPSHGQTSTWLHEDASTAKAQELLWAAINDALDDWAQNGLDGSLAELEKARQSIHKPAAQR